MHFLLFVLCIWLFGNNKPLFKIFGNYVTQQTYSIFFMGQGSKTFKQLRLTYVFLFRF